MRMKVNHKKMTKYTLLLFLVLNACMNFVTPIQASERLYEITIDGRNNQSEARAMLSMVNKERNKLGLRSLSWNNELENAAMQRAAEVSASFSHTRPNGDSWTTVSSLANGENISVGYRNTEDAFIGWMNSPGHKANMMANNFQSIGIASFEMNGVKCWVQLFSVTKGNDKITDTSPKDNNTNVNIDILSDHLGEFVVDQGYPFELSNGEGHQFYLYFINDGFSFLRCRISLKSVKWLSSNPSIFTVNENGKAIGGKDGNAKLTGNISKYPELNASLQIYSRDNEILPISMNLKYTTKTIKKGESYQFALVTTPSNANSTITWRIGNSNIASVDRNGNVKAKTIGNTYVYAESHNGVTAKCLIKVVAPAASSVNLKYSEKTLNVKERFKFYANVNPTDASQYVKWRVGNTNIATVDQAGNVTAKAGGNTYLYARTSNGKEARTLIKVRPDASSIKVNYSTKTLNVGEKLKFKATVSPQTALQRVTWSTGNKSIAVVDSAGNVKTKSRGNTYLYARSTNGLVYKTLLKVK